MPENGNGPETISFKNVPPGGVLRPCWTKGLALFGDPQKPINEVKCASNVQNLRIDSCKKLAASVVEPFVMHGLFLVVVG